MKAKSITAQEHTPGPWSFGIVVPGEPNEIFGSRTVEAPYDGESQTVAFVHPSTTGEGSTKIDADERDANARLIAAAPEMLNALTAARHYLSKRNLGKPAESLALSINSAIAKAKGNLVNSNHLPVSGSSIPNWQECQKWLMENGEVVSMANRGQVGEAAWAIWRQAFARGLFEGERLQREKGGVRC